MSQLQLVDHWCSNLRARLPISFQKYAGMGKIQGSVGICEDAQPVYWRIRGEGFPDRIRNFLLHFCQHENGYFVDVIGIEPEQFLVARYGH